jgi:hypothetical protein
MPIGLLAVAAGFSAATMLLWNWLMPSVFGLSAISFWQALGILVLCRLLFGSFSGLHRMHHRHHGNYGGGMHGRNHIREKWLKMTPEERKEFVNRRREQFSRGDFFGRSGFPFEEDENTQKAHE